MIRLLLDQGLPRSAAQILRQAGWDVVHVAECGLSAAADFAILEHARQESRTVCTLDADFHALLAVTGQKNPSVVRIRREGLRGEDMAALLTAIWPRIQEAIAAGAIVSVTEHALRFRFLPIVPSVSGG